MGAILFYLNITLGVKLLGVKSQAMFCQILNSVRHVILSAQKWSNLWPSNSICTHKDQNKQSSIFHCFASPRDPFSTYPWATTVFLAWIYCPHVSSSIQRSYIDCLVSTRNANLEKLQTECEPTGMCGSVCTHFKLSRGEDTGQMK